MLAAPKVFSNVFKRNNFHKNKIVSSKFRFYCIFSLTEYSKALPGLSTSYATLLRIKKSSSSSLFGSKTRPRYSSPPLGTLSASSPSWRGAAQHYYSPVNLYHSSDAFKQDGKCQRKMAPDRIKEAKKTDLRLLQ